MERNALQQQISSSQDILAAYREAAEELPVLKNKLDVVSQSLADSNKCREALEKDLSSANKLNADLDNTLTEKMKLISDLEKSINTVTDKISKESENHTLEIENLVNREKSLKDQLDSAKKSLAAAKAELNSRRDEIKTMKMTLSAASRGLEERDNTIKSLEEKLNKAAVEQAKTSDLLKEKIVAMNKIKVGY